MDNRFTFDLYYHSLRACRLTAPVLEEVARRDADLARQGRRALASIHLNIAESMDAPGKTRILRLRHALGSTNEVIACLDFAATVGDVVPNEEAMDALQHVRAILLKLVRKR